jgi:hypothetical protein
MALAKPAAMDMPKLRQSLPTIDAMFYFALSVMLIGVSVGFVLH